MTMHQHSVDRSVYLVLLFEQYPQWCIVCATLLAKRWNRLRVNEIKLAASINVLMKDASASARCFAFSVRIGIAFLLRRLAGPLTRKLIAPPG